MAATLHSTELNAAPQAVFVSDPLLLADPSTVAQPNLLESQSVPLSFRLLAGEPRPQIEVIHRDGEQRWLI